MNKPISVAIKETRDRIVSALNESQLPACVLEAILNPLYQQIAIAAQQETEREFVQYTHAKESAKPAESTGSEEQAETVAVKEAE